jgi:hypothetical protein
VTPEVVPPGPTSNVHPYLTALSIAMGIYSFGLQGLSPLALYVAWTKLLFHVIQKKGPHFVLLFTRFCYVF